jgi:hypothetical protein
MRYAFESASVDEAIKLFGHTMHYHKTYMSKLCTDVELGISIAEYVRTTAPRSYGEISRFVPGLYTLKHCYQQLDEISKPGKTSSILDAFGASGVIETSAYAAAQVARSHRFLGSRATYGFDNDNRSHQHHTIWPSEQRGLPSESGVTLDELAASTNLAETSLLGDFVMGQISDMDSFVTWCRKEGIKRVNKSVLGKYLHQLRVGKFLDEKHAASPIDNAAVPLTRILKLAFPSYQGPHADIVARGPMDVLARAAASLWLCSGERAGRLRLIGALTNLDRWLGAPSLELNDSDVPISNAMWTAYRLRPDLQKAFELSGQEGQRDFAMWFIKHGTFELALDPTATAPGFLKYLARPWSGRAGSELTIFHEYMWLSRPDIRSRFPLTDSASERRYIEFAGAPYYGTDVLLKFWGQRIASVRQPPPERSKSSIKGKDIPAKRPKVRAARAMRLNVAK